MINRPHLFFSLSQQVPLLLRGFGLMALTLLITSQPALAAPENLPLDVMFAKFVKDIAGPMMQTTYVGCYIFGLYVLMKGVFKCVKYSDEGSKGQQKFSGLWGNMLFGALLIALPSSLSTVANTLGFESNMAEPMLAYDNIDIDDTAIQEKMTRTYQSVLVFVQMLGLISFMRGLNILRSVTDGNNQVTSMAGITHLVAGGMAWNLGEFVEVLGNTVGFNLVT